MPICIYTYTAHVFLMPKSIPNWTHLEIVHETHSLATWHTLSYWGACSWHWQCVLGSQSILVAIEYAIHDHLSPKRNGNSPFRGVFSGLKLESKQYFLFQLWICTEEPHMWMWTCEVDAFCGTKSRLISKYFEKRIKRIFCLLLEGWSFREMKKSRYKLIVSSRFIITWS